MTLLDQEAENRTMEKYKPRRSLEQLNEPNIKEFDNLLARTRKFKLYSDHQRSSSLHEMPDLTKTDALPKNKKRLADVTS